MNENELSSYETVFMNLLCAMARPLNKWFHMCLWKYEKTCIRDERQVWKAWMFNNLRKGLNFKLEYSVL